MSAVLALILSSTATLASSPAPGLAQHLQQQALQDSPDTSTETTPAEPSTGASAGRPYQMQINGRFRYMSVPDSLIDIGFYDGDDPGYPQSQSRPRIWGLAYGAELVFDRGTSNYVLWGEYIDSKLKDGYWDDVDDDFVDHEDGDYVTPLSLGLGAVGFDFMHELEVVPMNADKGPVGLSFLFGAGLGVGFVTGELEFWQAGGLPDNVDTDCGTTSPAYERYEAGCAADGFKRIPKVVPLLDLSMSMRFNFSDHAHLRIDGGLHDILFVGTAVGAIF